MESAEPSVETICLRTTHPPATGAPWGGGGTLGAHPSQDGVLVPRRLSSPSSEVVIIYGRAGLLVFAHKGPALGPCHAGRHSSAFQPDNSGPSPLRRAGLCEQSSVDSQAALTLEEFQKRNNAGPAWASQAAAQSGPGRLRLGAASAVVWLVFQGKLRSGAEGGRLEWVQREKRGTKGNPSCV